MSSFTSFLYNSIFRRNTTMLATVFAGAFAMQLAFDTGSDRVWDSINRGRQWKDIKYKYIQKAEDDGDDDE
ncbi:putative ubiquinol-cytochrome C reductase complex, subunit X [Bimuria novae-zelandiae CBS 107.79]|uniref:Complex III subunit 9 n=1 Tax=Bimuria novae-zelandiae CBS 107.79 TaxID=1447943 RepID=A0A6A5UT28_9PLEO|nr:putative ubiquinol-cytochrome C reductase complex, subunit X [Bimuria novae-zelandiae CBS 107.79]